MSEEEIIKTLKEMIEKSRDLMEEDFYKLIGIHQIQAITSLLDLYNKEKEKNKILSIQIIENEKLYDKETARLGNLIQELLEEGDGK